MTITTPPPADSEVPRTQDRMTHDVWLPDEIVALRTQARAAVEKCVVPYAREIGQREESADSFPWGAFRDLADEGMFAVPFGRDYGRGSTHPMLGTCTVTEEIAYHSSSLAGVYDGQCILVPQTLTFATDAMRAQLIPELISGRTAFSSPPPNRTPVPISPPSACRRSPWKHPVVSWSTGASAGSPTALWLDGSRYSSARAGTPDLKMGHWGQITADVVFTDVHVPHENLLGTVGGGLGVALSALVRGRIGIGAAGVGVAQAALDLAVERLRTRHVFGAPLGAMQH